MRQASGPKRQLLVVQRSVYINKHHSYALLKKELEKTP